jgi:serine/threonine protein kinase
MGGCMSTNPKNSIAPGSGDNDQPLSSVGGTSKKFKKRNSRSSIGMQDVMGIKSTDDIENFYEIDAVIGRGAFGEVVRARHLFSNEYRAIKIIDKYKL